MNASCRSPMRPSNLPAPRGFVAIGAEIVDVVEHQKQRAAIFERVIARPVGALEGLARIFRVRRFVIEIVIAADIVPGQPDLPDDTVEPRIERQIVEHDVAGGHAEGGLGCRSAPLTTSSRMKSTSTALSGCGSVKSNDVEFLRLVGLGQREVDRIRQRAGRLDAAIAQIEVWRRAGRLMNVIEARQHRPRRPARHSRSA